jgi:hypothetical protein
MIVKGIVFIIGLSVLGLLFLIHNAMSKPIYNKMSNVWEDDPEGRKYANMAIVFMILIAFLLGIMF